MENFSQQRTQRYSLCFNKDAMSPQCTLVSELNKHQHYNRHYPLQCIFLVLCPLQLSNGEVSSPSCWKQLFSSIYCGCFPSVLLKIALSALLLPSPNARWNAVMALTVHEPLGSSSCTFLSCSLTKIHIIRPFNLSS